MACHLEPTLSEETGEVSPQRIRDGARKRTPGASILVIAKLAALGKEQEMGASLPSRRGFCHCQRGEGLAGAGRRGRPLLKSLISLTKGEKKPAPTAATAVE